MTHATEFLSDQLDTEDAVSDTPLSFPEPVGIHDYKAQREWERHQVQRGIERYRSSLQKIGEDGSIRARALVDLEPGQVIARDLIGPVLERVQATQTEYLAAFQNPDLKKLPEASWPITALPADRLAACAVLTALARPDPASFTVVARDCGTRVMHEIEFETWKANEAAAAKERKATNAPFEPDLFKLMLHRNTEVDMRVFKKWSNKAAHFVKGDWTPETKIHVGSVLMTLLVEASNWFNVENEWGEAKNRRRLTFSMSDEGRAFVACRHNQNELMRPFMLPMIAEPKDYEYPPEPETALEPALSLEDN
ncbi:hypothetical protein [Achromobacter sp. NFACC18-2]|uniref:hypothetical protein n=1 Tax=Achromobacter sp. NFACC18-2 TaxID=1564112 RepID=UPI0008B08475|nr:hypothetical protein [Achromobacter sp. NFACC18-2]SEJ84697.1 DNA-directed RNA polymerase N-terminal domain-containing protein [Achromobacter sp. NFACC18-2]